MTDPTHAIHETRTYWHWDPDQQKFVNETTELPREQLEEGEVSEEAHFSPGPENDGEKPGEEEEECPSCDGRGFVRYGFDDVKDCPYCGGRGVV